MSTAAQDERFAMAILAQVDCAGAVPWRRSFGENLERMATPNHNRSGGHSVEVSDCLRFMESAGNRQRQP